MAFIFVDQGKKIHTPVNSIIRRPGVQNVSASKATHDSVGLEKQLHSEGESFVQLLDHEKKNVKHREPGYLNTYDNLAPKQLQSGQHQVRATQIMSSPVFTQPREITFKDAWEHMTTQQIKHLIITDNNGQLSGILSKGDVLEHGKDSPVSIANFYTQQLIVAGPDTYATEVAECFIDYDINALPIMDGKDNLIGIVTRSDLLRRFIHSAVHIENWA